MPVTRSVDQRITAWRSALLRDGFSCEHVEELESHLLDAIDELRREHPDDVACDLAFEALGDPRTAHEEALRFPRATVLAIIYVAFCGLATLLNELLLLANGRFDTLAAVGGVVCSYGAWRIWKRSRAWLVAWQLVSVATLASLVAMLIACGMGLAWGADASLLAPALLAGLLILVTGWQLAVFRRPATRILF